MKVYIDDYSSDGDADGLGNGLETVLKTDATKGDTDSDGLSDSDEVYGVEHTHLPLMGANPREKDLFIEFDWNSSDPNSQMKPDDVEAIAAIFPSDISLHMDIGTTNTDPATRTKWNNWGGASAVSATADGTCANLAPNRAGLFHHYLIKSGGGGGAAGIGTCGYGGKATLTLAHELGHQMGLHHGGLRSAGSFNCRPIYRSVMNYAKDGGVTGFSGKTFLFGLDPNQVNERINHFSGHAWMLDVLENIPWRYKVDKISGWIDWNRDGKFSTYPVKAALNIQPGAVGCNAPMAHETKIEVKNGPQGSRFRDPRLAWAAESSPPGTNRWLYVFGRGDNQQVVFKRSFNGPGSCNSKPVFGAESSCTEFGATMLVPSSDSQRGYEQQDLDDKLVIKSNLSCSLTNPQACPPWL